jgi:hypothetical protein
MTIGYPISKTDLDNRMGEAVVTLRDAFNTILSLKALLDDSTILPDATLTTLGYTGSSASLEIQQIRAAFADMAKLSDISRALATQSSTNDFWFNAKHLAGLNFH